MKTTPTTYYQILMLFFYGLLTLSLSAQVDNTRPFEIYSVEACNNVDSTIVKISYNLRPFNLLSGKISVKLEIFFQGQLLSNPSVEGNLGEAVYPGSRNSIFWYKTKDIEGYDPDIEFKFSVEKTIVNSIRPNVPPKHSISTGKKFSIDGYIEYPRFPFPPPMATATQSISSKVFQNHRTYGAVNAMIVECLEGSGYLSSKRQYYAVPNGYAIVTRLEKINEDGSPRAGAERWEAKVKSTFKEFSILDYLKALVVGEEANFRVLVFMITDIPLTQSDKITEMTEAKSWLKKGMNALPDDLAEFEFTSSHKVNLLLYEFTQHESAKAELLKESRIDVEDHLVKTGIDELIE